MYYLINCNAQEINLRHPSLSSKELEGLEQLWGELEGFPESLPVIAVFTKSSILPSDLVNHPRVDGILLVSDEGSSVPAGVIHLKKEGTSSELYASLYSFFSQKRTEHFFYLDRIKTLESGMKDVVSVLEKEVLQARDSYKKVRKLMVKDFKSVKAQNLYKIGLNSGSEICEFVQKGNKLLWLSFCTKTYESSAYIIREVENILKMEYQGYEATREIFLNCGLRSSERNDQIHSMLMEIDLKTLQVRGNRFGNYYFLSTNKKNILFPNTFPFDRSFIEQSDFSLNLQRGEKALLLSPGVLSNYEDLKPEDDLTKFCLNHLEQGKEDLLDEIFIELREKFKDSFFEHDSYLSYLEVPENAILSID